MPYKVLIVPDKFKGTLTALQAADAMARGWRQGRPQDVLEVLPMSDGGDGFGEIVGRLLGATVQTAEAIDAAHRPCAVTWWWHADSATAVVESARVIGLAMLPKGRYHPFELDTEGLGLVLKAAAGCGARRCLVGIGGSATNDGAFGMARALGWQFRDGRGREISSWTRLRALEELGIPPTASLFDELTVAVDVQNRLLGPEGCTAIYGPQKGIRPEDYDLAEGCLARLAEVAREQFKRDFAAEPGSGAAGGLGFGLPCFAGARLEPGFALFARLASLRERLQSCQLVVTGEGAIDQSTLMGKGVGELARLCQEVNVPCLGLGGVVGDAARGSRRFTALHAMAPDLAPAEHAMVEPEAWLERLAAQTAAGFAPPVRS
jgi:glycerate 2-kinase